MAVRHKPDLFLNYLGRDQAEWQGPWASYSLHILTRIYMLYLHTCMYICMSKS